MKILFCISSLGKGGAERVVSVLTNELISRGHVVHIGLIVNRSICYDISEKANVHYLDCEKDQSLSFLKRYVRRISKIRKLIKELTPDIVISFMSETNIDVGFATMGMKTPLIVSERNDPVIDPASKAKQILRKLAYLKPTHFVFQTPEAQAYFSKRIQRKSSIILNPLSSNLPKRFDGEREKRIVSVGRLHPQKNIPLLIKAFSSFTKDYPEYSLEIYGEGTLEDKIKTMIVDKNLQDKVVLKGFCKDVHQKIVNASMFVMSSDYEGMPNALLEAMAIGLPCISTDCPCGGPRMLIQSGINGQLVPICDEKELEKAMQFLAKNPDKATQMGMAACNVSALASTSNVVDEWENSIRNSISN